MSTQNDALSILTAAVSARRDSLIALRGRISILTETIPVGAVLSDDAGEVCRVVRLFAGASQWANGTWDLTLRGRGLALPGEKRLLTADVPDSDHDGRNLHYRKTGYYGGVTQDGYEIGDELSFATGRDTRAAAVRLPRAIERYIELCRLEAQSNNETLR